MSEPVRSHPVRSAPVKAEPDMYALIIDASRRSDPERSACHRDERDRLEPDILAQTQLDSAIIANDKLTPRRSDPSSTECERFDPPRFALRRSRFDKLALESSTASRFEPRRIFTAGIATGAPSHGINKTRESAYYKGLSEEADKMASDRAGVEPQRHNPSSPTQRRRLRRGQRPRPYPMRLRPAARSVSPP